VITSRAVAHAALRYVGALYVWKGKGFELWTPAGLKLHGWGQTVFDCSGLIGQAVFDAGGIDRRASHSAQSYWDELAECPRADDFGALRFYGSSGSSITHISLSLGNGLVVEAAGGDSTTTTPELARRRPHARVRVGFDGRRDLQGARLLPLS